MSRSPVQERPVSEIASATRHQEFWAGVRLTTPLIIGAIPFGVIFGAVAVAGGLSAGATMAMSALVFAGSAQFVAAGLVASGAGVALIVLTTFVVNLRHALYAASLAPYMRRLPQRWLAPLAFWLTDESFLVVIERYRRADDSPHKHWFYLGSALFMYVNWQICTYIGVRAGQVIADPQEWGLDFALPVTFIAMLVPLVRNRAVLACVLTAAASALIFNGLPNRAGLIVAAVLGVGAGMLGEARQAA